MQLLKKVFFCLFLIGGSFSLSSSSTKIVGLSERCQLAIIPTLSDLNIVPADLNGDSKVAIDNAARLKIELRAQNKWDEISKICLEEVEQNSCQDCSKCHCSVTDCCYWGACYVCDGQCCH